MSDRQYNWEITDDSGDWIADFDPVALINYIEGIEEVHVEEVRPDGVNLEGVSFVVRHPETHEAFIVYVPREDIPEEILHQWGWVILQEASLDPLA